MFENLQKLNNIEANNYKRDIFTLGFIIDFTASYKSNKNYTKFVTIIDDSLIE